MSNDSVEAASRVTVPAFGDTMTVSGCAAGSWGQTAAAAIVQRADGWHDPIIMEGS